MRQKPSSTRALLLEFPPDDHGIGGLHPVDLRRSRELRMAVSGGNLGGKRYEIVSFVQDGPPAGPQLCEALGLYAASGFLNALVIDVQ
jgi:hypothetical protein